MTETTQQEERSWLDRVAAALLLLLLSGYLIFNKPFALLGFEPYLYIGELVLGVVVLLTLRRQLRFVVDACGRSWLYRLIALFCAYGLFRAALDARDFGIWSWRDSVVAAYAALAFVAPAALSCMPLQRPAALVSQYVRLLLPVSVLAAAWAALILFQYVSVKQSLWAETKIDLLTLSAAVACWVCAGLAAKHYPTTRGWKTSSALRSAICASAALGFFVLMLGLPTRAVWLCVVPLVGICLLGQANTRLRQIVVAAVAGLGLIGLCVLLLPRAGEAVAQVQAKYAPESELDFSIRELELSLKREPESYPIYEDDLNLTHLDAQARTERLKAMWSTDQKGFQTLAGQRGAHAAEWRLTFWLRTVHYTWAHAPLLGLGFGKNLTNLNRRTPDVRSRKAEAWRMYLPAMSLRNRNPHSAHLTVFARLGLVGVALWAAIIVGLLFSALRGCWRHAQARAAASDELRRDYHRGAFWDGLIVLGVWLIYLTAMSFGVVLENPMGGIWFWALSGTLCAFGLRACSESQPQTAGAGQA